jgi:hypothetical protein
MEDQDHVRLKLDGKHNSTSASGPLLDHDSPPDLVPSAISTGILEYDELALKAPLPVPVGGELLWNISAAVAELCAELGTTLPFGHLETP